MSILNKIVADKHLEVAAMSVPKAVAPCQQSFCDIFSRFAVIAECKAQSPSAGKIVDNYDAITAAKAYHQAGADAISVLTDEQYFAGSFADLQAVSEAVACPTLCKDFIIDAKQVLQARAAGASACLLIMAILNDEQVARLKQCIESLGMTAVIEVVNEQEKQRALVLHPQVLLINNRDLHDFTVDFAALKGLCEQVPESVFVVSASGIEQPQQVQQLPARINGVLVGTALMQADDKRQFIEVMHARS